MTDLLEWLRSLPPGALLAAAGLLVFGECTVGLGFIAPGETGLFILGTTVTSTSEFLLMWGVTTACAVAGDSVGFVIGRVLGPKLRETRLVRNHAANGWDRSMDVLRRRGTFAVLIGIFLPLLRAVMPAAAGASRLALRKFLPAVAIGAAGWCALHVALGMAAGAAAQQIEQAVGAGSWIVLGLLVAVVATVVLVKRRRTRHTGRS
ncbi:DedA family protein [Prauserella muralis]|uniref:DedA family protein n=1 Tax=Prauserella muralis TaxID=588067 RepID=UPI00319E38B4